jgi:hypothetical protein
MDPLHQQILDRLGGELDGQVFEDCACDLLSDAFPSLVPVRGGSDGGMDGAIADGKGEAFPLICTTGLDVKRNLEESLDSWLARERRPRRAVFATSQAITPKKRFQLEDAAREQGFTLIQVIDRHGMAQRLYRSPRWLRDLLGLSGAPSALSVVPLSRRPLLDLSPLGREDDLAWIRSTAGDLLIAGEPGSGKTFLFTSLIRDGLDGLFLVDHNNRGEIKKALLEQRPRAVIVDDAHLHPESLVMLRHLRGEMQEVFALMATSWTSERDRNAVVTALPGAQVRELSLLPRHQILEILRQGGIRESDEILRELVDQAANKPGLAATIAYLWKQGAWEDILEGKALRRQVLATFGNAGEGVEDLLAAFSLGGDCGMGLEPVRSFLDLSRPEIRHRAATLAAGGVLARRGDDALSVWPRRLRTSLLHTVFFAPSAATSDYHPLLAEAPSFAEAVRELATVRQLGARVPDIYDHLQQVGYEEESARSAWRRLAGTDDEEAGWVLENYPGDLLDVAFSLLLQIPGEVLPRLLARAAEEATGGRREGRTMSLLASWIQEPSPTRVEEALRRREAIAHAAKQFLGQGGDLGTGVQGICLALTPNQRGSTRDPGLGNNVTLWSALLPRPALLRIAAIWEQARRSIRELNRASWQEIESALWNWMHPAHSAPGARVPEDVRREMPEFALRVLGDLIPLAQESPGLRAGLARAAAKLNASLPIELDPSFELLYPEYYVESEPAREAARLEALADLAGVWQAELGPQEMARRVTWYEGEADKIGYGWPRGSQEICRQLAADVADPLPWLEVFVDQKLDNKFAAPLLERLVRERQAEWEKVTERCLELDRYQFGAIEAVLKLPDAPPSLIEKALHRAAAWPVQVETLALRREMPRDTLRTALGHPRWEVSLAAAVGEWYASKGVGIADHLLTDWREAILRAPAENSQTGFQHWLGVILTKDPNLALEWLLARVRDPESAVSPSTGPLASAAQALRTEQRAQLVAEVTPAPILDSLLPPIVGRDPELYSQLLARTQLRDYHLAPLNGKPDQEWSQLAALALDAGYPPERIADAAAWGSGHFFAGPGVEYWEDWEQAFIALEEHPSVGMREVGRQGRRIVEGELKTARSKQEQIALHGF